MKKVLFITPCELPIPAVQGGAIETLVTLLIEQNEKFHKADFFVISNYVEAAAVIAKEYKYTKIVYVKRNLEKEIIWNKKVFKWLRKPGNLCRIIVNHFFDKKIYFRIPQYDYFIYQRNRILSGLKLVPDIILIEGGNYYSLKKYINSHRDKKVFLHLHHEVYADKKLDKLYNRIIGVSDYITKTYQKSSRNKKCIGYTLRNSVDESKFNKTITKEQYIKLRRSLGFSSNDFVVLYCGRIIEVKGVKQLVEAINKIAQREIKLLLIGNVEFAIEKSSSYYENIKKMVKESGERIKHIAYINNAELYKYYQIADVQVIPSLYEEAAGLVAIEGMISGLPLIVTKSGGLVEYIDHNCAIEIEKNDEMISNLCNAITYLYQNDLIREEMSNAARKRAIQFRKENYYNEFINLIDK